MTVGMDYLHTTFFDQTGVLKGEWNLKISAGVVYSFGGGHHELRPTRTEDKAISTTHPTKLWQPTVVSPT